MGVVVVGCRSKSSSNTDEEVARRRGSIGADMSLEGSSGSNLASN